MSLTRRKFLAATAATAGFAMVGAGFWVRSSQRRSARLVRQLVNDARRRVADAPVTPDPSRWPGNAITVSWIGHATVLIDFYGLRILTDPVFGSRIGLSLGLGTLGPKRYIAPALSLAELPSIDVVLLSHAHMDHMDLPSINRLPAGTPTATARVTSDLLAGTSLNGAIELGWGDKTVFRTRNGELRVEAFEVKHWGRRWPNGIARGYNGSLISREGRSVIFGGDSAYTPAFERLRSRGPHALAIMPIAAYNPWIRNHCTPEEAVVMAEKAGARHIVPVHHQTFKLSEEPMDEPLARLREALRLEQDRLALHEVGGSFTVA